MKRIKFKKKGDQKNFILQIQNLTDLPYAHLARISNISERQFREWKNEKSTMSLYALNILTKTAGIEIPNNIEIVDAYEHTSRAGSIGGKAAFKKNKGLPFSEEHRLNGWKKWWETIGKNKHNPILLRKEIVRPKESPAFAELFGILIGDGGITKYQVNITLNCDTDHEYSIFVSELIRKLFKIEPKIYKIKGARAINICISSRNMVDFLIQKGLKMGHKINNGILIPNWILNSELYKKRCIRGMLDTDGSVFIEKHKIKGKIYEYPRLNFSSGSPLLIEQVKVILSEFGFNPKIRNKGKSVQLENIEEICKYFNIIGSSNPKHKERIKPWY